MMFSNTMAPPATARARPDWSCLDGLRPPSLRAWACFDNWRFHGRAESWNGTTILALALAHVLATQQGRLVGLLRDWDLRLREIGGEPSCRDWTSFRPLRLSREEDWSDWLAHLLETSASGRFAARLLGRSPSALANSEHWKIASAKREVVAAEHRADILVHFRDDSRCHVEVKIWDLALAKIVPTAKALRVVHGGTFRNDFLLIPKQHRRYWDELTAASSSDLSYIQAITWHDVVLALRSSVLETAEGVDWRVWSAAYIGAIEQRILGFRPWGRDETARKNVGLETLDRIDLLERGGHR